MAVDRDAPIPNVGKTHQQVHHRALAGARLADESNRFARLHVQVDVVQDLGIAVPERDVVVVDPALDRREFVGVRLVLHLRLDIQHLEDALASRHRRLERAVLLREVADRREEPVDHRHEQHQLADGEGFAEHQSPAEVDDRSGRCRRHEADRREEDGGILRRLDGGREVVPVDDAEVIAVDRLADIGLHDAHAGDTLGEVRVHDTDRAAGLPVGGLRVALPDTHDHHHDRQHKEAQQRQLPVREQHDRDDADEHQCVADNADNGVGEHLLDDGDIVLDARHHRADAAPVDIRDAEVLEVPEHAVSHVVHDPLPKPLGGEVLAPVRQEPQDHQHDERRADEVDHVHPLVIADFVDRPAEEQRQPEVRPRTEQDEDGGENELTAVRRQEANESPGDTRVIRLAEGIFIDLRANLSHAYRAPSTFVDDAVVPSGMSSMSTFASAMAWLATSWSCICNL